MRRALYDLSQLIYINSCWRIFGIPEATSISHPVRCDRATLERGGELPLSVQFILTNNDTSFCTITLYKSQPPKADVMKDVTSQWNEQVVKRLTKADKKPGRIYTQQMWDGWASTVAIGNFYQNKKKCVVMLSSFRKGKITACFVTEMSDKSFKQPVELFSKNLHLKNQ